MPDPNPRVEPEARVEIDAVIVSYRSAGTLRGCVAPLATMPGVRVTVIDNASPDDSLATIADLEGVDAVSAPRNGGFAYGCNLGAARGSAPYLLFLNPDARLDADSVESLAAVLRSHPRAALVGPKILEDDEGGGSLAFSLRRFPRLRSTFARALFLYRVFPLAPWADEMIRDPRAYESAGTHEWVSGACMLVRRDVYEELGGFDEGMFLYCEDTDLCKRVWDAGHEVRYEPRALVRHVGGHSSGAGETQPVVARSRIYYAHKHYSRPAAAMERAGVALEEATRALAALKRPANRRGHVRALRAALQPAARER